jgi:hypothetical protein
MKFFETTYAKLFSIGLFMFTLVPVLGQYNPNSVYSRFGLGLLDNSGNVTHYGMGGITAPISDPIALNLANPASYSFLEVTNLQATIKGISSTASTNTESTSYLNGQIHELSMGFKKPNAKWALAMGLTPYSSVDYRFAAKDTLNDTLFASYNYSGRGGINKATLGFSRLFRIGGASSDSTGKRLHQVSLGVNAHYMFGNITRENVAAFSQSEHYTTVENLNLWVKGIAWEAGLQYKVNLSTRRDLQNRIVGGSALQVGCSYWLNADLSAEYSELLYSLRITSNTALRDTAHMLEALDGRLKIPKKLVAGISYKIFNKKWGTFVMAGEYRVQDWSNYRLEISEDVNLDNGLQESTGWAVGMEYKPTTDVNNNFFNRLYYRAGYRSIQSALIINSVRIQQEVTTAGVTIPIIRSQSRIHLGAEWGTRGTREANLVEEKYVGFMVGFSLSPSSFDRWFRQVKYD